MSTQAKKILSTGKRMFKQTAEDKTALKQFRKAEQPTMGRLYGTLTCGRCYKPTLVVIEVGDDGYRLDRVESNCRHIPAKEVVRV
jgi:hypothetical protein